MEGFGEFRAANTRTSLMGKKSSRGVPLCCDASSSSRNDETKDRTEDGQDGDSSGDNTTDGAARQ